MKFIRFAFPARFLILVLAVCLLLLTGHVMGWMSIFKSSGCAVVGEDMIRDQTPSADRLLRVAVYPCGGFTGGLVANGGMKENRDSLFSKQYAVDVRFILVNSQDEGLEMLGKNQVDVIWSEAPVLPQRIPAYPCLNPAVFMLYGYSQGHHALFVREGIRAVSDLKAKRLVCIKGSAGHFLLLLLLQNNQIKREDVDWKFVLSDTDVIRILDKGEADAGFLSSPLWQSRLKRRDLVKIFSTEDAGRLIPGVFVVREGLLVQRADILEKFVRGWFEGVKEAQNNQDHAQRIVETAFGITGDNARKLIESWTGAGFETNADYFQLTDDAPWGYGDLQELSFRVWKASGYVKGLSQTSRVKYSSILSGLYQEYFKQKKKKKKSKDKADKHKGKLSGSGMVLYSGLRMNYPNNETDVSHLDSVRLKTVALTAYIFDRSIIRVQGLTDSREKKSSYYWEKRYKKIVRQLEDYGISGNRVLLEELLPYEPQKGQEGMKQVEIKIMASGREFDGNR